jgi:hypothetical protein
MWIGRDPVTITRRVIVLWVKTPLVVTACCLQLFLGLFEYILFSTTSWGLKGRSHISHLPIFPLRTQCSLMFLNTHLGIHQNVRKRYWILGSTFYDTLFSGLVYHGLFPKILGFSATDCGVEAVENVLKDVESIAAVKYWIVVKSFIYLQILQVL